MPQVAPIASIKSQTSSFIASPRNWVEDNSGSSRFACQVGVKGPHHRLCGEHFVSGRPSKDTEDVDYAPTIFKDGKRRHVTSKTPGREERAAKRA